MLKKIALATAALASLTCGAAGAATAPPAKSDRQVAAAFHRRWYTSKQTWTANRWMGLPTQQNPMDVWVTQEIIFETKPDVIVECGAARGGSAAFWAMVLSQVNPNGSVISIDIEDNMQNARELPIVQKYVTFLVGSSTSPTILAEVRKRVQGKKAMVILDSDHRKAHVAAELKLYSPLVPVGGYLIVQDTNINGHPVKTGFGPGPREAVDEFLARNKGFAADRGRERLMFTFCEMGFLKRVQ